jgi:hypothetical protein
LRRDLDRGQDRFDRAAVDRPALEGAVQVHDMQPGEAGSGEGAGLGRRVVVEHGRARHVAAQQAHGLAVLQIDGGVEDHGRSWWQHIRWRYIR